MHNQPLVPLDTIFLKQMHYITPISHLECDLNLAYVSGGLSLSLMCVGTTLGHQQASTNRPTHLFIKATKETSHYMIYTASVGATEDLALPLKNPLQKAH
jgi:hypothetical protein